MPGLVDGPGCSFLAPASEWQGRKSKLDSAEGKLDPPLFLGAMGPGREGMVGRKAVGSSLAQVWEGFKRASLIILHHSPDTNLNVHLDDGGDNTMCRRAELSPVHVPCSHYNYVLIVCFSICGSPKTEGDLISMIRSLESR